MIKLAASIIDENLIICLVGRVVLTHFAQTLHVWIVGGNLAFLNHALSICNRHHFSLLLKNFNAWL